MDKFNNRFERAGGRIREPKDRSIKTIQTDEQRWGQGG